MKKIILSILATAAISVSMFAQQDARQRSVQTIVSDVLAAMPAADASTLKTNMADLAAAAPQSVEILADMLSPAEKGANSRIEYALSGLSRYASANAAVLEAVKKGFETAIASQNDKYNKAFLEGELRLLGKAPAPEAWACVRALSEKEVLAAMKSTSVSERVRALNAAPCGEKFYQKLAKCKKAEGADADILYFFGERKAASQMDYIISKIGGKYSADAETAAARIGGTKAATALCGMASDALLFFNGNFEAELAAAYDKADAATKAKILDIASTRHITSFAPKAFEAGAYKNLKGLVTKNDCDALAALLDSCPAEAVADVSAAFTKAASESGDMFNAVASKIATAKNKARFFPAVAVSGTDEAVALLNIAYATGSAEALEALSNMDNPKVADILIDAISAKPVYIPRLVDIIMAGRNGGPSQIAGLEDAVIFGKLEKALECAVNDDQKIKVIDAMGDLKLARVFAAVDPYIKGTDNLSRAAALAVKKVMESCAREVDYNKLVEFADHAKKTLSTTGYADDAYAVDAINNALEKTRRYPTSSLTDQEKKQGFEMLYDGTDLDKWIGDKDGYKSFNGVINTTAEYGLSSGNLYTAKEYTDFIYRFEFVFLEPGVNSGVGIRTPQNVDAAYDGMCECQILDHDCPIYAGLNAYQVHGSAYGIIPAKRVVHKALGEWNCEEIEVRGTHIKVTLNGEVITDGDLREACQGHNVAPDGSDTNPYTVDHRNHPGMFNKKGHISFCGHGKGLQFRNIRILDLSKKRK